MARSPSPRDEDRYSPEMVRLFNDLRAVIVPFLDRAHLDIPEPKRTDLAMSAGLAIVGEHVAVLLALMTSAGVRQRAMESWIANLPSAVDKAIAAMRRDTLQ